MRLVNFKSLTIKNFLSVGERPVVIKFKPGVSVITGINRDKEDSKNGVGKSTILDALFFALYGTTIRDLNKDFIVNSQNKKNCEVVLDFEIVSSNGGTKKLYTITRQISPSKCTIACDEKDITLSTIIKTNELIQDLIRTPSNVFQNLVIMSVNNTLPFMMLSKIDKRKFIENVLNLEVFSKMLGLARDEYNTFKKDYEVVHAKKQLLEQTLEKNLKQINFFEQNKKTRINSVIEKIENYKKNIENLQNTVITIPDNVYMLFEKKENEIETALGEIAQQHESTLQKALTVKTEISAFHKQIKALQDASAVCPTCHRPFNEQTHHRENEIQIFQEKVRQLETELQPHERILENLKLRKNEYQVIRDELALKKKKVTEQININDTKTEKINFFIDNIKQCKKEIENIKIEANNELQIETEHIKNEIETFIEKLNVLNNDLHVLEAVKFIVSEEGVKTYIVKKILNILNTQINVYLQKLDANCVCTFNEFFEDSIIDEQNNKKSYYNFSGGERKRIDLACLFAFLDICRLQGGINFSTIFYDELIDSALDEKGIELTLNVLKDRYERYNESCYMITHRGSIALDSADNIIQLEKRNGQTYLLE